MPALRQPVAQLVGPSASPAASASAVEFVLEGLHLSKRFNKEAVGTGPSTAAGDGRPVGVTWSDAGRPLSSLGTHHRGSLHAPRSSPRTSP